jgi:hypothetical protein
MPYTFSQQMMVEMNRGGKMPMVVSWNETNDSIAEVNVGFTALDKVNRKDLLAKGNVSALEAIENFYQFRFVDHTSWDHLEHSYTSTK